MHVTGYAAGARMMTQQRSNEVIAENLANISTPGYREMRVQFAEWVHRMKDTDSPVGGRTLSLPQDRATWRNPQPGPLRFTGNPYDLALTGSGYFTVAAPNGTRLTRDGRTGLMPDGTLADRSGNAFLDRNGQPIRVAAEDGTISVSGDGVVSNRNGQVGQLNIVQPRDASRLSGEGGTLFDAPGGYDTMDKPGVVQGSIEDSNVNAVLVLTRLIDNHRGYDFAAQILQEEYDRQKAAIEQILPPTR